MFLEASLMFKNLQPWLYTPKHPILITWSRVPTIIIGFKIFHLDYMIRNFLLCDYMIQSQSFWLYAPKASTRTTCPKNASSWNILSKRFSLGICSKVHRIFPSIKWFKRFSLVFMFQKLWPWLHSIKPSSVISCSKSLSFGIWSKSVPHIPLLMCSKCF